MKVLFPASEGAPLIKTGGLADVAGSLPAAIHQRGQDVRLIIPAYPAAIEHLPQLEEVARFRVHAEEQEVRLVESRLPPHGLPVLLVAHEGCFDRPGNPYTGPEGNDWPDNARRFALFCRVIAAIARGKAGIDWRPDLVHCNDWQTGLVPALLAKDDKRPRTVFTIHNLAYQGVFPQSEFEALDLPWDLWSMEALEYHGDFSFIKGGIAFADCITTVSPGYAAEVVTELGGHGLDGVLRKYQRRLKGVLNGIDYDVWNPADDRYIPMHYDAGSFELKRHNKAALQETAGLKPKADSMLFAHIGRMVSQKGMDLITEIIPRLMALPDTQIVILGSGDRRLEAGARAAADQYPGRVSVHIGYDEPLSHLIEAGADCFLMPSRFEPCGLNQMYSLRYGTVPVVHHVGGLADTVVDTTPASALDGTATGFVFHRAEADDLWLAVQRAVDWYRRPGIWWKKLALNGMQQDFSWNASAQHYLECYSRSLGT